MCFYYSVNKKNPDELIKAGVVSKTQLEKIPDRLLVSGFERPEMAVISNENPNIIDFFQWGLVPSTIGDANQETDFLKSYNTLNAKIEGALRSKIYSEPIQKKRCLVIASGFFEWQHERGKKIPYYISFKDDSLFAFAGIWDKWMDENGNANHTFSILTTQANELMAKIHNTKKRMPVILHPSIAGEWLSPNLSSSDLALFHKPIDSEMLKAHTIKQFLPLRQPTDSLNDILDYHPYPDNDYKSSSSNSSQLKLDW